MKFRWKMLILLLVVSLTPLIIISASFYHSTLQLGNRLAKDTHKILTETSQGFLANLVEDYSRILNRDRELLEVMLKIQAKEINRRLAGPVPRHRPFTMGEAFDKGFIPPGRMSLSPKHSKTMASGRPEPTPVSYEDMVYFLVRGTDPAAVAGDMARLSLMTDFYKTIYSLRPEMILWQYVGLESGVQINYPGASGFPPDFDQRKRDWYKMAKQTDGLVWGPPVVDALTRITVLTLSMPVYYPDGSFAGVTAIDVLLPGVFKEMKLPAQWSKQAKIALVSPVTGNDGQKLSVAAQLSYLDLRQDWQTPVVLEFLDSDNPWQMEILIREAMAGNSGVCKMNFKGQEAVWAFGPHGPGHTFPVVIVPNESIIAQARETRKLALDMTRKELMFTGLILLGVLVMAGILAVFVSRRVTGPVTQLSRAATRMAEGEYTTKVKIRTGDELQDLGETFNSMGKELKLRQRQLVQADKMATLGILVAGMAHEINNPNSLILLNLRQLQRAWEDIAPILEDHYNTHGDFVVGGLDYTEMRKDIPQMLDDTEDRAERIKRIVNDLKDFSRREPLADTRSVDLNQVAKMAVRLTDNTIRKACNDFSIQLAQCLPMFKGNAQRIEQIVVNFLLNACQAIEHPDQSILLRTSFNEQTQELILDVLDLGAGVAPDHLALLTDPFFTTRREIGGTGLGLSVSAGIAEEHGGRIEFSSKPGTGTRARLILPRKRMED